MIGRLSLLVAAALAAGAGAAQTSQATPKQVVSEFFDLAFVQRKPTEAATRYISERQYIQHNPGGEDGREAFIKGFAAFVEKSEYRCEIKRVIAEGDLVVVHNHCRQRPRDASDRGTAAIDIFRVESGKIVEHWDVEQPVPAKSKNRNTMF